MINLEAGYAPPVPLNGDSGSLVSGQLTRTPAAVTGGVPAFGDTAEGPPTGASASRGLVMFPISDLFQGAAHPGVCLFHLLFKVLALITYLFGSLVFGGATEDGDFVVTFVFTLLLLSLDFWTVKNVSGRKLVGLGWHHRVGPDGGAEWVFRKAPGDKKICTMDYRVFWGGVVVWVLLWAALFINSIISLDFLWSLMALVGVVLSGVNFVAYYKCAQAQSPADIAVSTLRAVPWRQALFSRLGLA